MPELPVVLLEDFAALIGLVLALAGVGLSVAHRRARAGTPSGTLGIGVLLLAVAVVLAVEMKSLLMGESASKDAVAGSGPRWSTARASCGSSTSRRCTSARTSCSSPPRSRSSPELDLPGVARAIDDAEARVRAAEPQARVMYLEPDLDRTPAG